MMNHSNRISTYCLSLLLASLSLQTLGQEPLPPLPDWQVLEFEQRAFWATAKSRVELLAAPEEPQLWEMSASSSVVSNSEEVVLQVMPQNGRAVKRTRFSRGKDQRLKTFTYGPEFVLRERRSPQDKSDTPPEQWPVTNRSKIEYPLPPETAVVTDSYALLMLAHRLQASEEESMEVIVLTDFNFYRVRMTHGNGIPIKADYQIAGGQRVKGKRETTAVALQVTPEGPSVEKPDFSLLGLHGEIILFFDQESGLPLQVRGNAPRIGSTKINLKAVTMRKPSE